MDGSLTFANFRHVTDDKGAGAAPERVMPPGLAVIQTASAGFPDGAREGRGKPHSRGKLLGSPALARGILIQREPREIRGRASATHSWPLSLWPSRYQADRPHPWRPRRARLSHRHEPQRRPRARFGVAIRPPDGRFARGRFGRHRPLLSYDAMILAATRRLQDFGRHPRLRPVNVRRAFPATQDEWCSHG